MKTLSFQEIQDTINDVLAKNQLKPALNIEVKASMTTVGGGSDFFIVSIYQQEKCSRGLKIFHCFTCERLAMLKHQFQSSIEEKRRL